MDPIRIIGIVVGVLVLGVIGISAGCPKYNVYQSRLQGEAEYQRANANRNITILEAKALKESATYRAEAEVERAKGVAQANQIIGESLKGNESYLRYLWITNLEQGEHKETIYIPTEAGLPILEATRKIR